jgi:hypothetical protein
MALADRRELSRLTLQVERDLVTQRRLTTLLTAANTTLRHRRLELRNLNNRVTRGAERTHRRSVTDKNHP